MLMNIDVERDELDLDRDDEVTHGRCQIITGASTNPGIRRKSKLNALATGTNAPACGWCASAACNNRILEAPAVFNTCLDLLVPL